MSQQFEDPIWEATIDAKCFPSDAVSHPGPPSNGFTNAGGFESAAKS